MLCPHCNHETEPALRYHERGDCDLASIRPDPRYPHKCGVVFESPTVTHTCESPATRAGIIPHQYEHMAEEVRRLREENTRLRQLLYHLEWSHCGCNCCPCCLGPAETNEHRPGCKLAAALRG